MMSFAINFAPPGPPGSLCLPGDRIATLKAAPAGTTAPPVRLGAGVAEGPPRTICATRAGTPCFDERRSKLWMAPCGSQRRYVPAVGDAIVATVTERFGDEYRVEMRATDSANLAILSFEGATKRNKPVLAVGASVYCWVKVADGDMECEVSCIEPGSSGSWVSGETLYGELKGGGNIVEVSLSLASNLQAPDSPVLGTLGGKIRFESAVGANGRVWIKSGETKSTVLLCLLVAKADVLPLAEWKVHVGKILSQYAS